jgi:hypothetical protein
MKRGLGDVERSGRLLRGGGGFGCRRGVMIDIECANGMERDETQNK